MQDPPGVPPMNPSTSAPTSLIPTQEDKTHLSFRDPHFLQFYGGGIPTPNHALDYLALSPDFYDTACINEQIKMQTRYNSMDHTTLDSQKMTGTEYYVWYSDVVHQNFHILKQFKPSVARHAQPLAAYYVVQGNIYQAPDLYSLLASHLRTCLFNLNRAFREFSHHVRFHPAQGYQWEAEAPTRAPHLSGQASDKEPLTAQAERQLKNDQFAARVDAIIQRCAAKEHVVLNTKSPTPHALDVPAKPSLSEGGPAGGPAVAPDVPTPDPSVTGSVLSRKRKGKRDRDRESDRGSIGGESTVSKKRKKSKKSIKFAAGTAGAGPSEKN